MPLEIGYVEALFRYPVKSMRGDRLESAHLGWRGVDGDRRFAFRRINNRSAFPWLSASKLPELILYTPQQGNAAHGGSPTHVLTPDGNEVPVFSAELAADVEQRCEEPVQMMQLRNGMFDEADVSVIVSDTVSEICRLADTAPDVRRFRPNILIRALRPVAFQEDTWVGGILTFGEEDDAAEVAVTMRDVRCAMVNLDPDTAVPAPEVLKAVVRANRNNAGVYGAVTRVGRLAVGQRVILQDPPRA